MALAPNRTDHRWLAACQATEYTETQAQYQLRNADDITRQAYLFKRAADAGLDTSRWPEFEAAHELWVNRPEEKLYIEGLILGKAPFDRIAYEAGAEPNDITVFHDLFFDVTDKLDRPGWLVARMFQGNLYVGLSRRDRVGMMHRLGWLAGHEFLRSFYTGRWDDVIKDILHERLRDMMGKHSMLSSMCLGGQGELDVEVMRIFFDDAKKQVEDVVRKGGDAAMVAAVTEFVQGLAVEVANPLAPANLGLPAREPRAHELIASSLAKAAP